MDWCRKPHLLALDLSEKVSAKGWHFVWWMLLLRAPFGEIGIGRRCAQEKRPETGSGRVASAEQPLKKNEKNEKKRKKRKK